MTDSDEPILEEKVRYVEERLVERRKDLAYGLTQSQLVRRIRWIIVLGAICFAIVKALLKS